MELTNEFEVYRDGTLDPSFKRKQVIKKLKATVTAIEDISAVIVTKMVQSTDELFTPVKLDYFDWKYGTNLRAQWFSGKRTQQILQAKRNHGLL